MSMKGGRAIVGFDTFPSTFLSTSEFFVWTFLDVRSAPYLNCWVKIFQNRSVWSRSKVVRHFHQPRTCLQFNYEVGLCSELSISRLCDVMDLLLPSSGNQEQLTWISWLLFRKPRKKIQNHTSKSTSLSFYHWKVIAADHYSCIQVPPKQYTKHNTSGIWNSKRKKSLFNQDLVIDDCNWLE